MSSMEPCKSCSPAPHHIADRARRHARGHRQPSLAPTDRRCDIPAAPVVQMMKPPAPHALQPAAIGQPAQMTAQSFAPDRFAWLNLAQRGIRQTLTGLYLDFGEPVNC